MKGSLSVTAKDFVRASSLAMLAVAASTATIFAYTPEDDFLVENATARILRDNGQIRSVYGPDMSHGVTALDSANNFVSEYADLFGLNADDLFHRKVSDGNFEYDDQPLMYEKDLGEYKFKAVYYTQQYQGIPVYNGQLILLMQNAADYPLVLASSNLVDLSNFQLPLAANDNLQVIAPFGYRLVSDVEPVIYFVKDEGERGQAHLARHYVVMRGQPGEAVMFDMEGDSVVGSFDQRRIIEDAVTGKILLDESLIRTIDVYGNVSGWSTPGLLPDQSNNPPTLQLMPNFTVQVIGGNSGQTDDFGDYVITHGGSTDVTVRSKMIGPSLSAGVFDQTGSSILVDMLITPPGPADFEHNTGKTQYDTAEVNAMKFASIIHSWIGDINPSFPGLGRSFRANVNLSSTCNAYYDGSSINFYLAGGGCPNSAYSTVIWHEYGHKVIDDAASGPSGDYHEGMADGLAAVLPDTSHLGEDFYGQGSGPLRNADNNKQYPCSGEVHECGKVVSGCVWHTRDALTITEPVDYLDIIQALTLNSIAIHSGGVGPQMTIEFLTLDDNDGNLNNGTPHYNEIDAGFSQHNLPAPPLAFLSFAYPNGLPDMLDPDGGTTVRVEVSGLNSDPQPGTGRFYYNAGSGWVMKTMDVVSNNVYDAVFPAFNCETLVDFYFAAETTDGVEDTDPSGAPSKGVYSAFAAKDVTVVFADNFETDKGWTVENFNLSTGAWIRVVPSQGGSYEGDPVKDYDGSGKCFVTGNGFEEDLDGGPTVLTSPTFDMSSGDGFITYARWFFVSSNGARDYMTIEISNNNGSSWTQVERIGSVGEVWVERQIRVSDYVAPTSQMLMRFSVADNPNDSVTEGGVDAFSVIGLVCDQMVLDVDPLVAGQEANLTASNATPTEKVYFIYSLKGSGSTYVPALDVTLDLAKPKLAGNAVANGSGVAVLTKTVPMAARNQILWIQAAEYQRKSNVVMTQVN